MATVETPRGAVAEDSHELAGFGYKQELDRSLGSFSSFAAGFSYISILTGVTALFGLAYSFAGPGVWWTWPVIVGGQALVALCFMECAANYPIAGSVYQWGKQISSPMASWMTGWIYIVGAIVTITAVAIDWQVVLPQVSPKIFQILGSKADAGYYYTAGGAHNALLLGAILVIFGTVVNMLGVRIMARINNFGVMAELIGASILVILILFNAHRGPGIVLHNLGLGKGHSSHYFVAFIIRGIMSAYVLYGFDTAGSLAEETNNPRKNAPPAILRALIAAGIAGLLVILFGEMSVPNIQTSRLGSSGMPYLGKATLGATAGDLRYQVSLRETARECLVQTGMMTIRVGIQGRVIVGPPVADGLCLRAARPVRPEADFVVAGGGRFVHLPRLGIQVRHATACRR